MCAAIARRRRCPSLIQRVLTGTLSERDPVLGQRNETRVSLGALEPVFCGTDKTNEYMRYSLR